MPTIGHISSSTPRLVSACTDGLPDREKFDYWNEVICRTVIDLDCRPIEQPRFDASIEGFDAFGIGAYHIHTRAHLVYRGKQEIGRLDDDALMHLASRGRGMLGGSLARSV